MKMYQIHISSFSKFIRQSILFQLYLEPTEKDKTNRKNNQLSYFLINIFFYSWERLLPYLFLPSHMNQDNHILPENYLNF